MYKAVIFSIIGRVVVILAVLSFVFGLFYITQDKSCLWFLLLVIICNFIPAYEIKHRSNNDGKD